jgi:uncharacterized protein
MIPPKEFTLLIKPASAVCNLDCRYCFYKRALDVFPKKESYIMPDTVLRGLVRKYLATGVRQAGFSWQGGEPTLCGLDFYKKAVEYQMEFSASGQVISNALQTNGVLLDEKWARFLRQYRFLVGLSLDGPEEIHDRYRRDYAGHGTFRKVMRAATLMNEHQVEFNILTLLGEHNADKAEELYDFFTSQGFRYLQFIAPLDVEPGTGKIKPFGIKPSQYARFLCDLFDIWYEKGFPEVSIRDFDSVLSYHVDGKSLICPCQRECGSYLVVEHNGDVFPCDFYVFDEWRLGSIAGQEFADVFANRRYAEFRRLKTQLNHRCRKCEWLTMCYGDCVKYRLFQDGNPRNLSYFCLAMRTFFEHTHARFKKLARRVIEYRAANTEADARASQFLAGRGIPAPTDFRSVEP